MLGMQEQQGQPGQQNITALGNKEVAPRRAIDKLLMTQQQTQPRTMAFPMGVPQNEQPPQMLQTGNAPAASSFMDALIGNGR